MRRALILNMLGGRSFSFLRRARGAVSMGQDTFKGVGTQRAGRLPPPLVRQGGRWHGHIDPTDGRGWWAGGAAVIVCCLWRAFCAARPTAGFLSARSGGRARSRGRERRSMLMFSNGRQLGQQPPRVRADLWRNPQHLETPPVRAAAPVAGGRAPRTTHAMRQVEFDRHSAMNGMNGNNEVTHQVSVCTRAGPDRSDQSLWNTAHQLLWS
jgi:hypothetical protein